jgi:peptidoglycan/xylan/chitin deacetylase (PgdA/CDA1 family)
LEPSRYGPFEYSAIIDRPPLKWPNGARIALWVAPNIEYFHLDMKLAGGVAPNVPEWALRDYGNRVAVFRMMDTFDRYGLRATVCLNSDVCKYHPRIIEEGMKRKWEWMGHNTSNSLAPSELPKAEQQAMIKECLDTIQKQTGARPKGWLGPGLRESWDTLDILADEGIEYICDWCNDDQPVEMTLDSGKKLIAVQYAHELNDHPVFMRKNHTPDEFRDMICRSFDVLYREAETTGKVMAIALHPFLTGVPHRIGALDAALEYICKHDKVWRTTGMEIVDAFRAQRKT